jgi:hypothetical protein
MDDARAAQKLSVPAEISSGITDLQKAEQALADQNTAAIKAEQAARAPALQAYEKELLKKSERTEKEEANLIPLIAFETGAAILANTSPYGAANIGAGLQVGIASYKKGAAKIEDARDKMAEGLAKIEEVRRNESRMDAKELREAENAAKKPLIDAKKLMLSAYEKDWGLKEAQASKGVELLMKNQIALFEQQEATKRTAMTIQGQKEIANMLPGDARVAMTVGTGKTDAEKLTSGLETINSIKDRMTESKLAELYVKHKKEAEATAQTPLSPTEFAKTIKGIVAAYNPKVVDVPSAGAGKVYDRPGT